MTLKRTLHASLLLFLCTSANRALAQDVLVEVCHGQTEIGPSPQAYAPAAPQKSYPIGSWMRTADNASLTVSFDPKNRFRLLPNSEAQVTGPEKMGTEWHRVLVLKLGVASISHDSSTHLNLDCETPTSICGAEGTEFQVDATQGIFTVSEGQINVSSHQEKALSLTAVTAGGKLVYTPGSDNTWCDWARTNGTGNFSGMVHLGPLALKADGADFTIAKVLSFNQDTAIRIKTGTVGGYGPGMYLLKKGTLVPVPASAPAAVTFAQYLKAAKVESALSVEKAAYQAANRPLPPGLSADLATATTTADKLRHVLFPAP